MAEQLVSEKFCPRCGKTKPAEQFSVMKRGRDGLQSRCKLCQKEFRDTRYWGDESYRDKQREHWKKYAAQPGIRKRKTEQLKVTGNPLNRIARAMVGTAVSRGKLLPASSLVCSKCGIKQAEQYHHYNGYEKEHWFDIVPVCKDCHGIEHFRSINNE